MAVNNDFGDAKQEICVKKGIRKMWVEFAGMLAILPG